MAKFKGNLVTFNTIETNLFDSLISCLKEIVKEAVSCTLNARKHYICFSVNVQYDLNEKIVKNIINLLNKKMSFADLFSKKGTEWQEFEMKTKKFYSKTFTV